MEKEEAYISDKAIEDALDFMESGDEMTDEEIEALMSDDDTVQSVGDLLDIKRATLESSPLTRIDADGEWEKFRTRMQPAAKKTQRHTLYYFMAGAAAAIVIMVAIAATKRHTFIVEANGIEARVLGTEFNVRSYDRGDVHVTLIQGSVEVTTSEQHTARLTPGQDAQLNDDGSLGVAEVDIESYLYWRDGYFYFDDISLENIMQDIGRWYNLNVVFQNADARNYHMHFLADKRGGIDHVVKLLNSMGKVTVTLKDNTLMVR